MRINENEKRVNENKKLRKYNVKRIILSFIIVGIYVFLCIFFLKYVNLNENNTAEFFFVFSCFFFLFGFIGFIIPLKFYSVFFKFGAKLLSTSEYHADLVVSKKEGYKTFRHSIITMIIISYVILIIFIIINK